jgi:hypothetical protein
MRFSPRSLILAAAVFGTVACASSPSEPGGVTAILTTTSFGFCAGYCETALEIGPDQMSFVEQSRRGELPTRTRSAPISSAEWDALIRALDRRAIETLPDTVGCPDCADGGAESLAVVGADWQKRVIFEHGARMPELQPLLDRVRTLRGRFETTR